MISRGVGEKRKNIQSRHGIDNKLQKGWDTKELQKAAIKGAVKKELQKDNLVRRRETSCKSRILPNFGKAVKYDKRCIISYN